MRRPCVVLQVASGQQLYQPARGGFTPGGPPLQHEPLTVWTPTQQMYRNLMKAILGAYSSDIAELFWSRHRIKIEIYKYAAAEGDDRELTIAVGEEVARFVQQHMKIDADRIHEHNETMLRLPVPEAKRFREEYLEREAEHVSWCKQRIKRILAKRPLAPYPYS